MMRWAGASVLVAVVAVGMGARAATAQDQAADIEAVCPCDATMDGEAWASHGDYVACVVGEARRLRLAGGLRPKEMRAAIRAAKRSTCGNPHLTRCCVYEHFDDDVGRCRIMSPDACDVLDDRLDLQDGAADNEGSGSCLPNPCAF